MTPPSPWIGSVMNATTLFSRKAFSSAAASPNGTSTVPD